MAWRAGLSTTIKELRFFLNPRAPQSDGCRLVIENHYTFLKGLNPNLKFLVRERNAPDYDPVIQAEFMQNKVEEVSVKGMSEEQVLGVLKKFQIMGKEMDQQFPPPFSKTSGWNEKLPSFPHTEHPSFVARQNDA